MMDHVPQPVDRSTPRDFSLGPVEILSAVALAAGVTACLTWPVWRRSASDPARQRLIAYLRDHLSGADMAIRVVSRLGSMQQGTEARTLFRRLAKEFDEDRSVVRKLLTQLGASGQSIKRTAGLASGTVLSMTAGGEPGDLSLFRTLEGLAIGVQGKRCLWRGLQSLRTVPPTTDGTNFVELEARAVRQWEAIEECRRAVVTQTFSATDPSLHPRR